MSRKRIRSLLVIPGADHGSSYIFSKRQAAMLRLADVETDMFFIESRTSPALIARDLMLLRHRINVFRPHLIHAQYGTMNAFLAAISALLPLIVTFRGSDLNPVPSIGRVRSFLGHGLSHLAALRASAVICVSTQLRRKLWWRRRRCEVIIGGVNLELFRPMAVQEARARLGWAPEKRIVLFNAGRHPEVKRLDLAEAAVREARLLRNDIHMVATWGDVDPDLMPLYFSAADCLLVTSDWEGSPTVIKEALACNLPVVSVDVGDVAERLAGVTHSAIVARDPVSLGAAIANIAGSGTRSNGREAVMGLSEIEEVERIRLLYDAVIGAKS